MGGLLFMLVAAVYLCVCLCLGILLARRVRHWGLRTFLLISTVTLLSPLPIVDGLWGARNLERLCELYSQTELLGSVEVPPSFIVSSGPPPYLNKDNGINWDVLRPYVFYRSDDEQIVERFTTIKRTTMRLYRTTDNVELSRRIYLRYDGGWLKASDSGDGVGANSCSSKPIFEAVLPRLFVAQR